MPTPPDCTIYGVGSETPQRIARFGENPFGVSSLTKGQDLRTQAERDCDRILYSWQWRRLAGVTQVTSPFDDGLLIHNRLTHSEKVAQVARSIAKKLLNEETNRELMTHFGGFSTYVCQSAAMAHDLGHPPFGHIGEEVLDRLARNELGLSDGFEGNAQTFRIVAIGRTRSMNSEGLDLTATTLAAIAKYPWPRVLKLNDDHHDRQLKLDSTYRREWRKFNAYQPEVGLLLWSRAFVKNLAPKTQTLEASVMDVADDISYAVHDLEDFYFAGLLDVPALIEDLTKVKDGKASGTPFYELSNKLELDYAGYFQSTEFQDAAEQVAKNLSQGLKARQRGIGATPRINEEYRQSQARATTSEMIGRYINAVVLSENPLWPNGPHIGLKRPEWHQVQLLKEIAKSYVITRTDIALLQHGQQLILTNLVEMLNDWVKTDKERLPSRLLEEIQKAESQGEGYELEYYQRHEHGIVEIPTDYAPRGDPNRAILDYICSLTDAQCQALHHKLRGYQVHRVGFSFDS